MHRMHILKKSANYTNWTLLKRATPRREFITQWGNKNITQRLNKFNTIKKRAGSLEARYFYLARIIPAALASIALHHCETVSPCF